MKKAIKKTATRQNTKPTVSNRSLAAYKANITRMTAAMKGLKGKARTEQAARIKATEQRMAGA